MTLARKCARRWEAPAVRAAAETVAVGAEEWAEEGSAAVVEWAVAADKAETTAAR